MQQEFDFNYPSLNVELLGVNEFGADTDVPGSVDTFTDGRDIPLLQDVDVNPHNGLSDVWYDYWGAIWRDVVIRNPDGSLVDVYNLTPNSLADPANYEVLKEKFIDAAATPAETPWQNPIEPLDVNNDAIISPTDVLTVINHLEIVGGGPLDGVTPDPTKYVDPNGDGIAAPTDAIVVINQLIFNNLAQSGSAAAADAPLDVAATSTADDIRTAAIEYLMSQPRYAGDAPGLPSDDSVFLSFKTDAGYSDVPEKLLDQFSNLDRTVLNFSAATFHNSGGVINHKTGEPGVILFLSDKIQSFDDSSVQVHGGTIMGNLGATGMNLRLQFIDGSWSVVSRELAWIS